MYCVDILSVFYCYIKNKIFIETVIYRIVKKFTNKQLLFILSQWLDFTKEIQRIKSICIGDGLIKRFFI